jgi:hypothetical protein
VTSAAQAQTPQPFPRPGEPSRPEPPVARPQPPPDAKVSPPAPDAKALPAGTVLAPTEQTLGLPIYPGAQFITSYDAGRGQRYYLFGTTTGFVEIVAYYRSILKQRGDLVYEQPPIHMFEVGRFREETMAFPPGVTVKDYTWGGSEGYINPKPGAQPAYFRTIIQIVPAPPPAAGVGRE